MMYDTVFSFDVDNTLLGNDRIQADPRRDRAWHSGPQPVPGRKNCGMNRPCADYPVALERYRLEGMHDPRLLRISNWLAEYPFGQAEEGHHFWDIISGTLKST